MIIFQTTTVRIFDVALVAVGPLVIVRNNASPYYRHWTTDYLQERFEEAAMADHWMIADKLDAELRFRAIADGQFVS